MRPVTALLTTAGLLVAMTGTVAAAPPGSTDRGKARTTDGATQLYGVTALSAKNAWAVGYTADTDTLVEHWDGSAWTKVPSPSPSTYSALYDVSGVSAADVWAVGQSSDNSVFSALIEHWDGHSWAQVAPANLANATLKAVFAVSSDDVWAVGMQNLGSSARTLVEHWDGSDWTKVPSPNPGGTNTSGLQDVTAVSADDVWAVGFYNTAPDGGARAFIEHWDGTRWSRVASAHPGNPVNEMVAESVSVVSATDVWAVGWLTDATGPSGFVEHWNGKKWSLLPGLPRGEKGYKLTSVSALSDHAAWMVGIRLTDTQRTLVARWDGTRWHEVAVPSPGKFPYVYAVSARSATNAWVVGAKASFTRGLALHWDGTRWTAVPPAAPAG